MSIHCFLSLAAQKGTAYVLPQYFFLDNRSPPFYLIIKAKGHTGYPLRDRHEICTQVLCGVKAENLLSKNIPPPSTSSLLAWRL